MNTPLAVRIECAKGEILNAMETIQKRHALPPCIMDGVLSSVLAEVRSEAKIPEPSNITHVDDGVVVIIPYDYLEYNRKYHNKSIKKTLTIPEWLNNEALRLNLNFSQILQDALLNKIQSR